MKANSILASGQLCRQVEAETEQPDTEARQKLAQLRRQLGDLDAAKARREDPDAELDPLVLAHSLNRCTILLARA